jgi:hypothetical protein
MMSHKTFLIDKCGRKVNEWTSQYNPGLATYLIDHGVLLRTGADSTNNTFGVVGGIIEKRDWNNNLLWQYKISNTQECQHHDIHLMPNGNILAIVWDLKTKPEAIAMGRRPAFTSNFVWSEKIVELQPVGTTSANIIWEWYLWDHVVQDFDSTKPNYAVVKDHPELVDINRYSGPFKPDWIHMNSVDYNPITDQILLSTHTFNEIWIIDHSTTSAQAAAHSGGLSGKGGDLLYRWGNPVTYKRGTLADQKLFGQHNAQWLKPGFPNEGKILIFNNGNGRTPVDYSSIDIIAPPIDNNYHYTIDSIAAFLPTALTWTYTAPLATDFYSPNIAGVEPVIDGSFVICEGATGRFFEINPNSQVVWEYMNPYSYMGPLAQYSNPVMNNVFRASFFPVDHPNLNGLNLTPGNPIEINPISPSLCDSITLNIPETGPSATIVVSPNPATTFINIKMPEGTHVSYINIFNLQGQRVLTSKKTDRIDLRNLPAGMYMIHIISNDATFKNRLILH